jgi:hypothetical protein
MIRFRAPALLLGMVALVIGATAAANPVKLVGTVAALQGADLTVTSPSGVAEHVQLADTARIGLRIPVDATAITANSFVGATAAPRADGTLVASEVHIFPESMRGTGEGHRPMDGPAGTTMTNATVTTVAAKPQSTMTNATVGNVAKGAGSLTLTLEYKGGAQTIIVPDGTPIVMVESADRAALARGSHVIVYADRDPLGITVAQRVSVGKNGSVPPI